MLARTPPLKSDPPIKRLSHEQLVDLATLFLSDPNNREVKERLLGACLERVTRAIEAYVSEKYIPNLVIDEAVSLAQAQLTNSLHKLKSPTKLMAWLRVIARNAAITEFRRNIIGKGKDERVAVPLEAQSPEGRVIQMLDRGGSREAAQRYKSMMGSEALADFPENVETRHLLRQLLTIHAKSDKKRDRDSAFWVQTMLVDGISNGDPVDEIAKARGTTRDDVLHVLKEDCRALHNIYRRLCGSYE